MTTLTSPTFVDLLDRLFAEASNTASAAQLAVADLTEEEQVTMMCSKTDYRKLYARFKDVALPVSRTTGTLLYMLARSCRAHTIVEFGTSFGLSTLYLAAALRDNGGGRLITTEFESDKITRAKQHLNEAGLIDLIDFREGDALQTLSINLPDAIDLVLLDGAKGLYPDVLKQVESRLQPGALIVADDASYSTEYLAYVNDPSHGYLSLSLPEDVLLSVCVDLENGLCDPVLGTNEIDTSP